MRNFAWLFFIMIASLSAGCTARFVEGPPPGWDLAEAPDYLQDRVRMMANDGERNWVVHLNEIATAALRRGDREVAKRALDEAILQIEVIYGDSDQARQARSLWRSEGRKIFKGDPYERSMVFFYRGVLYMQDEDWDNARACFRSALFQDSIAEEQNYEADWALFHYLIGVCEIQLNDVSSAQDAFALAAQKYYGLDATIANSDEYLPKGEGDWQLVESLPVFTDDTNLLVITQQGKGPLKTTKGEFDELLAYRDGVNGARIPLLLIDQNTLSEPTILDSVTFQARTRGGRPLDAILKGQAKFKETGEEFGVFGTQAGSAVLLSGGNRKTDEQVVVGGALIAAGALAYGVSSLVRPEADTRGWKTLPESLAISPNSIEQGDYVLAVQYDANQEPEIFTINIPSKGQGLEVVLTFPPF